MQKTDVSEISFNGNLPILRALLAVIRRFEDAHSSFVYFYFRTGFGSFFVGAGSDPAKSFR